MEFDPAKLRYVVCARAGDPLAREARARLIWAANTAAATSSLGVPTTLVSSASGLNFKVNNPTMRDACHRLLDFFYSARGDFDIHLTNPPSKRVIEKAQIDPLAWQVEQDIQNNILPKTALFHSRDPAINQICHNNKIPFIYEDHSEDFHTAIKNMEEARLESEWCRGIIAIAPEVKTRLTGIGVHPDKIIVVESGLNDTGKSHVPAPFTRWKQLAKRGGYDSLAVYTGGMQEERDIRAIVMSAKTHKNTLFAFAGGNDKDLQTWRDVCEREDIYNTLFLGYLPFQDVSELQAEADILLYTRQAGPRAFITSPLKLFEYLSTGKKVVAAQLPQLRAVAAKDLPITWYNPNAHELTDKIGEALRMPAPTPTQEALAKEFATKFTWRKRQERILKFAQAITVAETEAG